MLIAWIAISGAVGTVGRYGLSRLMAPHLPMPLGTWIINVAGSLAIGLIWGWVVRAPGGASPLSTAVMVGLLGGFTTFSAFSLETVQLFSEGRPAMAIIYAIGCPAVCILATAGGRWLTHPF